MFKHLIDEKIARTVERIERIREDLMEGSGIIRNVSEEANSGHFWCGYEVFAYLFVKISMLVDYIYIYIKRKPEILLLVSELIVPSELSSPPPPH